MANEKRLIPESERANLIRCLKKLHDCDFTPGVYEHSVLGRAALFLEETVDAVEVVHAYWEDGVCSNCKGEALSTSWDEPIYEYDWEENLRYSHTETHTEYRLTDYCPNCGAKMDGGNEDV